MAEEITLNANQFRAKFRCPNCGNIFEKALQKGVISTGRGGTCPNCGVTDGQASVGHFNVIKLNEDHELLSRATYNSPRM